MSIRKKECINNTKNVSRLQRTGIIYRSDDPRYWKEYHEKFRKPRLEAKKKAAQFSAGRLEENENEIKAEILGK